MKKYLLTGLIVLLPAALTLMIIIFLFDFFTGPFVNIVGPFTAYIQLKLNIVFPEGFNLFLSRIFALIFLCIFIFFLGIVTQWFLVKNIISWTNKIIARIPFINTVYKVAKDVFSALFSTDGKKAFKKPVMMPFPCRPNFCFGFQAGEVAQECQEKIPTRLVSVFTPTAPHPISGFLFLVPENDVTDLDMTNEEVVKFLVSCGMILSKKEMDEEKNENEIF